MFQFKQRPDAPGLWIRKGKYGQVYSVYYSCAKRDHLSATPASYGGYGEETVSLSSLTPGGWAEIGALLDFAEAGA